MGKINFAIKGTFKDFYTGNFPTFTRRSPLFIEKFVDDSIDLIPVASNEPAIYDNGNFVISPATANLLTYSDDLKNPDWVAGSNVFIRRDTTRGAVTIRQEADSIAVIAGQGQQDEESQRRQILRRTLYLTPEKTYTAWAILRLSNGLAGLSDVFRAVQGGKTLGQISLGELLNEKLGKMTVVEFQFTPKDATPVDLEFFIENSLTLNVTGLQIEERNFRSFFMYQQSEIISTEKSNIYYHQSPLRGLNTFGVLGAIDYWRGDGAILECGDFKIRIEEKKLVVYVGTTRIAIPSAMPQKGMFYVQVVSESQTLSIYLDGILVARSQAPNLYRVSEAPMVLTSEGVRCYQHLLCTEGLFEDGRIEIGQMALKDVRRLFESSPIPSELIGSATKKIIGKPVEVPQMKMGEAGFLIPGYAAVRMPFLAIDPLEIEKVFPATNEIQVNSVLAFKVGDAFIQSLKGVDIRTVNVLSIDNVSRRVKLDTVELVLPGMIISQPIPNGETIIPWQNYRVEFLHPNPDVSVVASYGNGIVLANKSNQPQNIVPVYEINL